jgi:hypothetical protein
MKKITHPADIGSRKAKPDLKPSDSSLLDLGSMYYIVWRDAFTETDEWHNADTLSTKDYLCATVGFLVEENTKKNYYTVASTKSADGEFYTCVINIPKSMVVTKKQIRLL